jgi:hypothetical protein
MRYDDRNVGVPFLWARSLGTFPLGLQLLMRQAAAVGMFLGFFGLGVSAHFSAGAVDKFAQDIARALDASDVCD